MTKNKTVIKARHSFVTVPEKTATCAEPGNNSYEKCSVCGEERNKQILTAPHAFAWIAAKEATCTEDGYSAYRKCKVCGTETGKTIIKAGHEMADKPVATRLAPKTDLLRIKNVWFAASSSEKKR